MSFGSHYKVKHITDDPPSPKDSMYDDWLAIDFRVTTWLINNMESNIVSDVLFLTPTKKIRS